MITIYHVPNTRSLRVVWLMEELGEDYRLEQMRFPLDDAYRDINPLGCVPAIDDDGIRMFESLAILQYITGRRLVAGDGKAAALTVGPRPEPAHYAEHLQFLHFGEASLTVPVSLIFRTRIFAGEQNNATLADQLGQLTTRLAFLDDHLAGGREWVTGESFTIADISIGYAFHLAEFGAVECPLPTNVAAYWERLKARPAYRRAAAR